MKELLWITALLFQCRWTYGYTRHHFVRRKTTNHLSSSLYYKRLTKQRSATRPQSLSTASNYGTGIKESVADVQYPISSSPQVLQFIEPTTNVTVVLVGSMHYNPSSIQLATSTINSIAKTPLRSSDDNNNNYYSLASVLIESCDIRYNQTIQGNRQFPLVFRTFLNNEMRAATVATQSHGRPVVLGDQRINVTTTNINIALKETIRDLVTPWDGGWQRYYKDVKDAATMALPTGKEYINAKGFFEEKLLLCTPISLIKYPLSYLVRSPVLSGLFLYLLWEWSVASTSVPLPFLSDNLFGDNVGNPSTTIEEILVSVCIAGLETAVFARVLLKTLLAERNEVIARNILTQCRLYSASLPSSSSCIGHDDEALYIPFDSSHALRETRSGNEEKVRKNPVVVAVLGMAHCNGIMKLLKEQLVR